MKQVQTSQPLPMQVCRTATSRYGVNNYNYHNNNVSYCVSHIRKETEDYKYAQSTEVISHFNATSG